MNEAREDLRERRGRRIHIDEPHRRVAGGEFPGAPDVGHHDRAAAGQRLDLGQAQTLVRARRDQDVRTEETRRGVLHVPDHPNVIAHAALIDGMLDLPESALGRGTPRRG